MPRRGTPGMIEFNVLWEQYGIMHEKYKKQLLILTGMSGAGKTVAAHSLEDVGYFVVDNLPPELLGNFWDLMNTSEDFEKVAVVIDLRVKSFYKDLIDEINSLEDSGQTQAKRSFGNPPYDRTLSNHNRLLSLYPEAIGVKTG